MGYNFHEECNLLVPALATSQATVVLKGLNLNATLWNVTPPKTLSTLRGLLLLGLCVLVLDQATKIAASSSLTLGVSEPVVAHVNLTLVHNRGMAFGVLSDENSSYKFLLVNLLSLLAVGAVVYFVITSPASEVWGRRGFALILVGALGNILDRLRLGYVVDFVDVYYGSSHWPAFNVADSAICIGVGLLIVENLLRRDGSEGDAASLAEPKP